MNRIIIEHLKKNNIYNSFESVNSVIYAAANAVVRFFGCTIYHPKKTQHVIQAPSWEHRLTDDIEILRREVGRIAQYINGNRSETITHTFQRLLNLNHTKYDPALGTAEQIPTR